MGLEQGSLSSGSGLSSFYHLNTVCRKDVIWSGQPQNPIAVCPLVDIPPYPFDTLTSHSAFRVPFCKYHFSILKPSQAALYPQIWDFPTWHSRPFPVWFLHTFQILYLVCSLLKNKFIMCGLPAPWLFPAILLLLSSFLSRGVWQEGETARGQSRNRIEPYTTNHKGLTSFGSQLNRCVNIAK